MKVIVAGYSKTGTKSMHAALQQLGYNVYDFLEHFWYHEEDWKKILTKGGSIEDFKRMYENVDTIMDAPVFYFWEEIHKAFPDAKIVFTTRDEESWIRSFKKQIDELNGNIIYRTMRILSPTGRRYYKYEGLWASIIFGGALPSPFSPMVVNEMISLRNYRQHASYILQKAPKDKLLVYDVKEGWEPLCKFLGKEIPDAPFPRKNVSGKVIELYMRENPVMKRMFKETVVCGLLLTGLFIFGGYKICKHRAWEKCLDLTKNVASRFCP